MEIDRIRQKLRSLEVYKAKNITLPLDLDQYRMDVRYLLQALEKAEAERDALQVSRWGSLKRKGKSKD